MATRGAKPPTPIPPKPPTLLELEARIVELEARVQAFERRARPPERVDVGDPVTVNGVEIGRVRRQG